VRILIDTHVFLWAILEPHRLSPVMTRLLMDPDNELLMSVASIWEIGTKYARGHLPLKVPPELLVPQQMQMQNIQPLAVLMEHALQAHQLPLHHRDPFDRMLIAQAVVEKLPLMTADPQFRHYPITIL
jgi:PIN domain nuclease of toxin-antitoxin system